MQNKRNTATNKSDRLPDYIVSEEDYKADLASGLSEDEVLKPGTYKVRRSPWAEKLKNAGKVKITIYLDNEVVEHFRARAEQPNAAPYQTQINNELRKVMEGELVTPGDVEWPLLENERFLRTLKAKLCSIEEEKAEWSQWRAIPSPEECRKINAPKGAGVYQIRNRKTDELVLFGHSETCQGRMKSLFPKPYGTGYRTNTKKRDYVLKHWRDLQYRTIETPTVHEARQIEKELKSKKNHLFNT
ncbi:MAG TPA: BrnA antitoxin family protein [Pyrinomonadaceae bacterium]|nr:BrnA antitoxin family protein [Pyrinomonadaceae bacterium]